MDSQPQNQRLSGISTQWTMLFQVHVEQGDATKAALATLLERYSGAVYRYLLGAVRDPDVARDLGQEFALRFCSRRFSRANPERGRFRDYLKTALVHLVNDHYRLLQAWPRQMAPKAPEPVAPAEAGATSEVDFVATWRAEVLDRTWKALADVNPSYHAALRYRIDNVDAKAAEIAEHLTSFHGKPVTAAGARKTLERAHAKYANLLLQEVAYTLEDASNGELERELKELDLLKYCRSALQRLP